MFLYTLVRWLLQHYHVLTTLSVRTNHMLLVVKCTIFKYVSTGGVHTLTSLSTTDIPGDEKDEDDEALSGDVVAGVAIGGVLIILALVLMVVVICLCLWKAIAYKGNYEPKQRSADIERHNCMQSYSIPVHAIWSDY